MVNVSNDFWTSPEGIDRRLAMFSEDFSYNVVNNSLQVYGGANDVAGFLGIGGSTKHCIYCSEHIIGLIFNKGQFLPRLPAHNYCSCSWELVSKGE
jgi:hypothetical protein